MTAVDGFCDTKGKKIFGEYAWLFKKRLVLNPEKGFTPSADGVQEVIVKAVAVLREDLPGRSLRRHSVLGKMIEIVGYSSPL